MALLKIDISGNPKTIPYRTLITIADNSLGVLDDLDHAFSERPHGSLDWYMNDVGQNGSLRLEIYSRVKRFKRKELPDVSRKVAESFVTGFNMLEHQERTPAYLTQKGMGRALRMIEPLGREGAQKLIATTPDKSGEADITPRSGDNLRRLMPENSRAFGSVEGKLEGISVHNKLDVIIYESIHGKAVTCHIANSDLVNKVKDNLGARVRVTGEVSRNIRSEPRKVWVARPEDFKVFGTDLKVLPFRRLGGSDPDFTGELSTEEFIRAIRG